MNETGLRGLCFVAAAAAFLVPIGAAGAGPAPAPPRLPFSDDVAPPPPLPVALDRAFKGEIVDFDGDRITLRWNWKSAEQLEDFESFVPIRATLRGGFVVKDGRVCAEGTAGIRVKLGFVSDLEVHVGPTVLHDPHDLGIVLPAPGSSDESVLCLVQDKLFTRFDRAAGNTNMINKIGGILSPTVGMTEFRYVSRSIAPHIEPGAEASFDVVRKVAETTFVITLTGSKDSTTLKGKDTDTPMTRFTPGLYVSGGAADFGQLTISGRIDMPWCAANGVIPNFADKLLHPGNKWKPADRKFAELVERYAKQDAAKESDPKKLVAPEAVAPIVGNFNVPLAIRIRAAEALLEHGDADAVVERLAAILDAKDQPARTLAWQILRPRLPWHFKYEVDADPKSRREAAQLIGAYLRSRADNEAQGSVYVEGEWQASEKADSTRSAWERAWELRTPRIRLRTNMSRQWADWYLGGLEAEYRELVKLVGRGPPPPNLPLSVFVFKDAADMSAFCMANGYTDKAAWTRFTDLDRNVGFSVFEKKDGLANTMGQFAKQFHHFATGHHWPTWYDEGRASWFGNADYGTVGWDGTTLRVGIVGRGHTVKQLMRLAVRDTMPRIEDVVAKDKSSLSHLTAEQRKMWYVEAWALHAWLVDFAGKEIRDRFAEWQAFMDNAAPSAHDVDDVGLTAFFKHFAKDLAQMNTQFKEWVKTL